MSGYIEGGYIVTLGTLALYGASLAARERSARRRLRGGPEPREPGEREASERGEGGGR